MQNLHGAIFMPKILERGDANGQEGEEEAMQSVLQQTASDCRLCDSAAVAGAVCSARA